MVFKCKMCGGDITPKQGTNIGICSYCKSTMTLPNLENEKIVNLYNRANDLRLANRFDEAKEIYEKILLINNAEIEAHWGILLCRYGIEYVDDPNTNKKIPTCHRTIDSSILVDADFKFIKKEAYGEALELYKNEAKVIDEIQNGILSISKKEKPYDVFICYKETDEAGERTKDSVIAEDIYDKLVLQGLKVFFARITLESKLGMEYEPYIYSALKSAKVMLVVGTKEEHFNAVWVKNEWLRFLEMMKTNKEKHLIPVYSGIDAYKLPEEFAMLQAQNMDKIGAMQDIVRGIKKILDEYKDDSEYEEINKETIEKVAAAIGDARSLGNGSYEVTVVKERLPVWYYLLISATFVFGFFFSLMLLSNEVFYHLVTKESYSVIDLIRYVTGNGLLILWGMFVLFMIISLLCFIINRKTFKLRKYFLITGLLIFLEFNMLPIKYGYMPFRFPFVLNIRDLDGVFFFYFIFVTLFLLLWFIKPTWQINTSGKTLMNEEEKNKQLAKNQEIKNNFSRKDDSKVNKKFLLGIFLTLVVLFFINIYTSLAACKGTNKDDTIDQVEIMVSKEMTKLPGSKYYNGQVKKGEFYNLINVVVKDNKMYLGIKNKAGIFGYINRASVNINCVSDKCLQMFKQTNDRNPEVKQLIVTTEYINIRASSYASSVNLGRVYKDEIYTILDKAGYQEIWYKIKTSNGIEGWIAGSFNKEKMVDILD